MRPPTRVTDDPSRWWQYAGAAVLVECRKRLPTRNAARALELRRQYISLYRAMHSGKRDFLHDRRAYRTMPSEHSTRLRG
jgi:hypothetical protein